MPMALPLLAAAGSIGAGIAAGGMIGGMLIAGGAMTGLGALTGDKTLSKWGGILSLAGGVGGLATGAWSGMAEGLAGEAAADAATSQAWASGAGLGQDTVSAVGGSLSEPAAAAASQAAGNVGAASAGALPSAAPALSAPSVAAPSVAASSTVAPGASTVAADAPGMLQSLKTGASDTLKWIANPANGRVVQAGAGLLQAGLGAYGQQEALKEQIKMQEDAQARARQRLNDSVKGVSIPVYQPVRG